MSDLNVQIEDERRMHNAWVNEHNNLRRIAEDDLRGKLAVAYGEVAELLPVLDAQSMTISNLVRDLKAAKALEWELWTAFEMIIENRINDSGPCKDKVGCSCSECIARAALAAINKEKGGIDE